MECKHEWNEEESGPCALCIIEQQQEQNSARLSPSDTYASLFDIFRLNGIVGGCRNIVKTILRNSALKAVKKLRHFYKITCQQRYLLWWQP